MPISGQCFAHWTKLLVINRRHQAFACSSASPLDPHFVSGVCALQAVCRAAIGARSRENRVQANADHHAYQAGPGSPEGPPADPARTRTPLAAVSPSAIVMSGPRNAALNFLSPAFDAARALAAEVGLVGPIHPDAGPLVTATPLVAPGRSFRRVSAITCFQAITQARLELAESLLPVVNEVGEVVAVERGARQVDPREAEAASARRQAQREQQRARRDRIDGREAAGQKPRLQQIMDGLTEGPLSLLHKARRLWRRRRVRRAALARAWQLFTSTLPAQAVQSGGRVRVKTRHIAGERGEAEGALVAYDKWMNMVLRDVEETYVVRVRRAKHYVTPAREVGSDRTATDELARATSSPWDAAFGWAREGAAGNGVPSGHAGHEASDPEAVRVVGADDDLDGAVQAERGGEGMDESGAASGDAVDSRHGRRHRIRWLWKQERRSRKLQQVLIRGDCVIAVYVPPRPGDRDGEGRQASLAAGGMAAAKGPSGRGGSGRRGKQLH